jgi:hypothetical protein
MKSQKVSTVYEDNEATGVQSVILTIDGLREIGNGQFELTGVKQRKINWDQVKSGFGGLGDDKAEKLADLLFKLDMVELLTERVRT